MNNRRCLSPIGRLLKPVIQIIDPHEVLDKVVDLPIARWTYNRDSDDVRHLGPMAEDLHTAFGLGASNKGIASLDSSGVALASIHALHQDLQGQQIESLKKDLYNQYKELTDLKKMVHALVAKDQVAVLNVSQ